LSSILVRYKTPNYYSKITIDNMNDRVILTISTRAALNIKY